MLDLDTELRRLARAIADQAPEPPQFRTLDSPEGSLPTSRLSRRNGVVALVAALLVLSSIVAVGVFVRGGTSNHRRILDAPTTTALVPTVSVTVAKALLLPVDRADMSKLRALQGFVSSVVLEAGREGIEGTSGRRPPGTIVPVTTDHGNIVLFEGPDVLRRFGFGVAESVTRSQQQQPVPDLHLSPECTTEAQTAVAPLMDLVESVL